MNKQLSSATKTKQFKSLIDAGLKMTSTERQLENGTIALSGKIGRGRNTKTVRYAITANGAVLSNEFVARRVTSYREGLAAACELLAKRVG
jgi:hypothetical protein